MKKILSFVLLVVLLVMLFPTTALAVEIQAGRGTPTVNSSVIGFAGQEWWVIGDNSSGVTAPTGHVTLLAKGYTPMATVLLTPAEIASMKMVNCIEQCRISFQVIVQVKRH